MNAALGIIVTLFQIYFYIIIVYILMSWVPNARESTFGVMIGRIVEPYLEPFRRIIPPLGMLDLSPIVAIIALRLAQRGVIEIFYMFA